MTGDFDETKHEQGESNRRLVDSLVEEFSEQLQNGERPQIATFVEAHPDIEVELRKALSSLVDNDVTRPSSKPDETSAREPDRPERMTIGDYQIIRKIGQGGMGVVYEAQQTSLGRRVALKMLPSHISSDKKYIERFKREARAAAKLHHTNIVPVYDVGQDGDSIYYAMQYIRGQGLNEIKKEIIRLNKDSSTTSGSSASKILSGSNSPSNDSSSVKKLDYYKSVAKIGASVADALNYAHERSVIHRDIKPANLILDTEGVIWLADFGLAKTIDSELTETGDFLGTARYMSPERLKGIGDHRGDIYALGVSLYELATLGHPFEADDRVELLNQIANAEPRRPRDIRPDIPLDLETIILKAMDKEPKRRYQNAANMADDLRRFVDDQSIRARRASTLERSIRWVRRNKALTTAIVSMAVAIVVLIVGTVTTLQQRNLAQANESHAREEKNRADVEAGKARQATVVTVEALTHLVDTVQTEMRNHPELLELKTGILTNAESKLQKVAELTDDSPQTIMLKTDALFMMGKINYEVGEYARSKRFYEQALQLTKQFSQEPDARARCFRSRSSILAGLGSIASKLYDQDESRMFYVQALENDQAWKTAFPDDQMASTSVASSADNVADTYVLLNDRNWDTAEEFHLIAYQTRQSLRRAGVKNYHLDYDLATSNMKLGDMHYGRAKDPELNLTEQQFEEEMQTAKLWFTKSREQFDQVVKDYPNDSVRSLRSLAASYERIADTLEGKSAQEHYTKALEIREQLAPQLLLDRNFQRDLAVNWGRASMRYNKENQPTKALECMNKCLTILQETSKRIPDDTGLLIDIMVTYAQLANMSEDEDRTKALLKSKAIGDELIESGVIPGDHPLYKQLIGMLDEVEQ